MLAIICVYINVCVRIALKVGQHLNIIENPIIFLKSHSCVQTLYKYTDEYKIH